MALIPLFLVFLSISLSPIHAKTDSCSSYKFTNNQLFTQCTILPHLSSSLHWTYQSSTGSLSIAFVAPPASPNGWIAWAINPISDGMLGSQALIAFKQSNGSMNVNTYNITSYASIEESKILYETSDLSAEFGSDGNMILFGTMKIGMGVQSVNQVYQVGSSVTKGVPDKHAFSPDNLQTGAKLDLTGKVAAGPGLAPSATADTDGVPGPSMAGAPGSPGTPTGSMAGRMRGLSGLESVLFVALIEFLVNFFVRF